jgi:hypothetical protein
MWFDRFDIVEAFYCYMVDYHGGQSSKEYRLTGVFAKLEFSPRPNLDADTLTENGRAIYDALVNGSAKLRDRRAGALEVTK